MSSTLLNYYSHEPIYIFYFLLRSLQFTHEEDSIICPVFVQPKIHFGLNQEPKLNIKGTISRVYQVDEQTCFHLFELEHNKQAWIRCMNIKQLIHFKQKYKIQINHRSMLKLVILLFFFCCCLVNTLEIDLNQLSPRENVALIKSSCNKDTQIDFIFSPLSSIQCKGTYKCSYSPSGAIDQLKFLDANGNDLVLNLDSFYMLDSSKINIVNLNINNTAISPKNYFVFKYKNSGSNIVFVAIPLADSNDAKNLPGVYELKMNFLKQLISFNFVLKTPLFNFLNRPDLGKFYHVTDEGKQITLLFSTIVLRLGFATTLTPDLNLITELPSVISYQKADKLCYGSNEVQGLFQTHLRQSYPLWAWVISIIFYWFYYLFADSETHQSCYDKKFQENSLTCWGFYSLHHLGHVEYFSRLSRLSVLYFVFSFQAMVLAALYSTLGDNKDPFSNFQMIIWTASIAFGASLPIPYLMGGVFLRKIYEITLKKFDALKKSRGTMIITKKSQNESEFQQQIDQLEERLYKYYYFFYITIFVGMVCFWVPSIYMMMQIHRSWYYLHRIWLASLAITFVIDNLIFDPLLSCLFGKTSFYRSRGYFYRFQLGQQYKEIQD